MVLFLAALFLLLAYLLPLYAAPLVRRARGVPGDLFSPVLFFCGLGLLGTPYLFLVAADRSRMAPELRHSIWVDDLQAVTVGYVAVMALSLGLNLLGAASPAAGWAARRVPVLSADRFTPARVDRAILAAMVTGVLMYLYYIQSVGGLQLLWTYMYLRTQLSGGMGYLTMVYTLLLTIAAALLVYRLRFRPSPLRRVGTAAALAFLTVVLGSTGGRSPLIFLLVVCFVTHHYGVRRRRRLLTPANLVVGAAVFLFVLAAPMFRAGGAYEKYTRHPVLLVRDGMDNLSRGLAPQFSGYDRSIVMLSYFTPERMWLGRSYVDLLYAPIPRSLFPQKPPVDDGVYMKEIVDGRPVVPSRPMSEMMPTSWPMGNFVPYMNFGLAGLVVAMFLSGVAVGAAYRAVPLSGNAPSSSFFYAYLAMGGISLSVFGIVNLLMNGAVLAAFFWLFFAPKRWPRPARAAAPAAVPA